MAVWETAHTRGSHHSPSPAAGRIPAQPAPPAVARDAVRDSRCLTVRQRCRVSPCSALLAMEAGWESERSLEERREQRRREREALLAQAKSDYEKEERRKLQKRLRGEDTWMLPDVNERVEQLEEEHSGKKKKKKEKHSKKSKKEKKKNKKHKSEKKDDTDDSSSVSKRLKRLHCFVLFCFFILKREEWMNLDFMSLKTTSLASVKSERQKEKMLERQKAREIEQAVLSERELNPYWKDGGTGLPPEEDESASVKKVTVVEDAGLSWLRKSYQRMKEQAEREKRNIEEIVAERYGSMEAFQSRLEEAEKVAPKKENDYRSGRWRKPDYSEHEKKGHRMKDETRHGDGYSSKVEKHLDEKRSKEKSVSLSDIKHKFLKPSDDDPSSYSASGDYRSHGSSSKLPLHSSLSNRFQKPSEDTPLWNKTHTQGNHERSMSDQKPSDTAAKNDGERTQSFDKEKSREEYPASIPEKKQTLSDNVTACSRYFTNPRVLSEDEMNKLGARIVKAELMGNMVMCLKNYDNLLQFCTQCFKDEQVILVRTDQSGRAWPVTAGAEPKEPKGGRRKRQMVTTHVDKERVRYFQDDDSMSMQDLVRKEKMRTAEDQNALFMRMASKLMEKTDRDYYTLDDMFVSQAAKKARLGEEEETQRRRAIHEHQQLAARMEKCPYCFDSGELSKHLIIAIGTKVYLSLPSNQSLIEGHCLIAPLQHHTAATLLDEEIWEEIQMFRTALVKMFEAKGLDCVFMETNMSMKKRYHMVYECIPLPKEVGDMAPIYFKKAIMESDEEWSMNKKIIDLSSKDVRKSVPKGLPYFSVDFGLQGGFAHIIEDQHKFPHYFGKEIIGGMLDLEPRLWRKGVRQKFEEQRKKVLQFAQWWKPYDFTKKKE
uniref:CWF19-like protein 2 n=1 Tax=Coturnix japonica TaxID=93934 RepID=A0A8C2SSS4_COTJA